MNLVVCPLKKEWEFFEKALQKREIACERMQDQGRWYLDIPSLQAKAAMGGHGKAQFALQTQFWIDKFKPEKLFTIGASGALNDELQVGDVILVSEIKEHDFKDLFANPTPYPLFKTQTLEFIAAETKFDGFSIHPSRLACGDEDIVTKLRAQEVTRLTQAQCVAWESAGGVRASLWNKIPYIEIRGITDHAHGNVSSDFIENLEMAMDHCVEVFLQALK